MIIHSKVSGDDYDDEIICIGPGGGGGSGGVSITRPTRLENYTNQR